MPGPTELLILLAIVALLFGTKKLRSMGGDLGSAINSFKNALKRILVQWCCFFIKSALIRDICPK